MEDHIASEIVLTPTAEKATRSTRLRLSIVLFGGIVFTFLFHRQGLGINVLMIEGGVFFALWRLRDLRLPARNARTVGMGVLITAAFSILTHSVFVYVMHFISLLLFTGILVYPEVRSLLPAIGLAVMNLLEAPLRWIREISQANISGSSLSARIWRWRIFFLPLIIVCIFLVIYSQSNPVFDRLLGRFGTAISDVLEAIFKNFDAWMICTFLLGLVLLSAFFVRVARPSLIAADQNATDQLARRRRKHTQRFQFNALKNEYRAGVFLLVILNAILLLVNVIDINWVWITFDWEAQDLKQFVHEGTYLLILSILISIALVLYFFRRNLNFYKQNKWLKYLSYAWLLQNALLAVSVGRRNFYYIEHFNLAYKRIGVIIFLLMTLFGLCSVLWKVLHGKSASYLFRVNLFACYILLTFSSLFNWDAIIARYNFAHADSAFLHLDFLSDLSNKALPTLDRSLEEMIALDKMQDEKFPFATNYMSPEEYHALIQYRKTQFKLKWESKSILAWNLPDYLAYQSIKASL